MVSKKELARYFRQVAGWLPCRKAQKTRTMELFKTGVLEFLENNPEADMDALRSRFGSPETVAASYLEGMDSPDVLRKLRIRRAIVRIIAVAVAAALAVWLLAVGLAMMDAMDDSRGNLVDQGITEI